MASTIKRRRFQAPITSFFTTQSPSSSDSSSTPSQPQPQPLSTSPLPEAIQSSLLTVGMRIRKSVPEGYKTHKPASLYNSHPNPYVSDSDGGNRARTTHTPCTTELTPFCGLHKIGGMAVQPMPMPAAPVPNNKIYSDYGQRPAEEEEEGLFWSSSQESVDSNANAPAAVSSNKRDFFKFDDDDDDEDVVVTGASQGQQQHTTYSYSFGDSTVTNRAFAVPRGRSSNSYSHLHPKRKILNGQENLGLGLDSKALLGELDFEDADFLVAREHVDLDEMMDGC